MERPFIYLVHTPYILRIIHRAEDPVWNPILHDDPDMQYRLFRNSKYKGPGLKLESRHAMVCLEPIGMILHVLQYWVPRCLLRKSSSSSC